MRRVEGERRHVPQVIRYAGEHPLAQQRRNQAAAVGRMDNGFEVTFIPALLTGLALVTVVLIADLLFAPKLGDYVKALDQMLARFIPTPQEVAEAIRNYYQQPRQ